ncbi:MAG: hypothetical protein JNN30_19035 [Rhodanobacteraceae bacterium]|nr:hypothetical protein [Rhodanobacteraceae bacterium]
MNNLILLVENESSWSPLVWAVERGGEVMEDGRVVIDNSQGWLAIHHDQSVLDDFDNEEKAQALAALVAPAIFVVEWQGDALIETFVKAVPSDCRAFVDNDRAAFAPIALLQSLPFPAWARAVAWP